MSPPHKEIEVERAERGCGRSRPPVHAAVAVFFVVAALLNGPALHRDAQLMKFGRGRDLALRFTAPLAKVSHTLYLDRPRQWLESWADRRLHTPVETDDLSEE